MISKTIFSPSNTSFFLDEASNGLLFLNQETIGTGFPVTLAINVIVPFSLTVCSWKRSINNGACGPGSSANLFEIIICLNINKVPGKYDLYCYSNILEKIQNKYIFNLN